MPEPRLDEAFRRIEALEKLIDGRPSAVRGDLDEAFRRIETLEKRVGALEGRVGALEGRFEDVERACGHSPNETCPTCYPLPRD